MSDDRDDHGLIDVSRLTMRSCLLSSKNPTSGGHWTTSSLQARIVWGFTDSILGSEGLQLVKSEALSGASLPALNIGYGRREGFGSPT